MHLLPIAREAKLELYLDEVQEMSDRTPMLGEFQPSGQ